VRSADRIAGAALLALAVAYGASALRAFPYWGENGPGPAFLPFWLGLVMALLATMMLVGALRSRDPGASWLPRGEGLRRIALVLVATIVYALLLNVLGMAVATALFLIVLVRWPDRRPWTTALAVGVAVSALNWLVFTRGLRVPMPTGVFGF
jgi:hypothetical protein